MEKISKNSLYIAWTVALIGTLGSLYFSEIRDFAPCPLCWYQRIALYPLVLILGAGIILKDKNVFYYAFPLAAIGAAVGLYQNLLYYKVLPETAALCTFGVSCTNRYLEWFGFIDIPLLSFASFIILALSLLLYKKNYDQGS